MDISYCWCYNCNRSNLLLLQKEIKNSNRGWPHPHLACEVNMKKTILLFTILLASLTVLIRPVYAVGDINGPDVIYKDSNEIVNANDITSLYTSSSAGILIHEDNFTGNGHIPGNHKIILKATDGLTEKFKEITITVTQNKIPDVTIDNQTYNLFSLVGVASNNYTFV